MTRKRHTEEQIIAVLKDAQAGVSVQDLCRKHGISDATFYKWRTKYAGLEVSDVKKLRQLEEENRRLYLGGPLRIGHVTTSGRGCSALCSAPCVQSTPRN